MAATGAAGNADLWVLPLFGDRKPFSLLATPFAEGTGRFSPDGRWVAYQSNESGQDEVYVISFPGAAGSAGQGTNTAAGKWQVSAGGGAAPLWRRDGKELFYFAPNTGTMMAASVDGRGPAFSVGRVEPTFAVRLSSLGPQTLGPQYSVAPDGQRFLVALAEESRRDAASQPVTVVVNWTAALRK